MAKKNIINEMKPETTYRDNDKVEIKSKEKEGVMHYPWMYNFERGMPWEGIGYLEWKNKNLGITTNS